MPVTGLGRVRWQKNSTAKVFLTNSYIGYQMSQEVNVDIELLNIETAHAAICKRNVILSLVFFVPQYPYNRDTDSE